MSRSRGLPWLVLALVFGLLGIRIHASTPVTITAGEIKLGAFTVPGQLDQYEFAGSTGEVVTIQFVGEYFFTSPSLSLYGPDGSLVVSTNGTDSSATIRAQLLLQTGTYRAICGGSVDTGTNQYTVTLAKVVGDNPMDEDAAT